MPDIRRYSPRQIASAVVFTCITGAVALCCAVIAVGLLLAMPKHAVIGPPIGELASAQPVRIASASGSLLSGWWIEGRRGGGAVILMHGVHANRLSMVRRARKLHQQGFAVLLFDFQAHGESPGQKITFGHLEALDAEAAVMFVRQRLPGERVGAIGVSQGGAAALLGPKPLPVDALVLESVYPDIRPALTNRLRVYLGPVGPVIIPVVTPLFELLMPPILGFEMKELRPIDHIGEVTAPLLLLSGTADDRTPIAEAEALYERAPKTTRFWAVPGAGHVDLERYDPNAYWAFVLPFLQHNLQHPSN